MTKAEAYLPAGRDKSEVIIENPQVVSLSKAGRYIYGQLADIYFFSWNREGLCDSLDEASLKINSFDPEETFIVSDTSSGLVLAMINTLPVRAASIEDLCRQLPTYKSVEEASSKAQKVFQPNFRICFSIVASPGFRILRGESSQGKTESLSSFLIRNLPQSPKIHQIAYSRYSTITPNTNLVDYYFANLNNPQALGPVGMHEHLGGLAVAFIENSRPEDTRGGGNILVLYPNSEEEQLRFDRIKKARAAKKLATFKKIASLTFFLDL